MSTMKTNFRACSAYLSAVAALLILALALVAAPSALASATNVENPRVSNGVTTWDCVWFGSYPQTKIASNSSLRGASWSSNGDAVVRGVKSRRLKKSSATGVSSASGCYKWGSTKTLYFRYDPIKWRVLAVSGPKALLISDKALDCQKYNLSKTSVTWENCTLRSWLNGYGSSSNKYGKSYSSKSFIDTAFTDSEQSAIYLASLLNEDNGKYGTDGGNSTNDKIFLLSDSDVRGSSISSSYGFSRDNEVRDKARRCKTSTYSYANGTRRSTKSSYSGRCVWPLRSAGIDGKNVESVRTVGTVGLGGAVVNYTHFGIRPSCWVDLGSSFIRYAGTVSSDNSSDTIKIDGSVTLAVEEECYRIASPKPRSFYLGAVSHEGGKLTFKSSSSKVSASSSGKVTIAGGYCGDVTITASAASTSFATSDSKTVSLRVRPKKMTIESAYSSNAGTLEFTWEKPSVRSGFEWQIMVYGGTWSTASINPVGSTESSVTFSGLKSGNSYQVRLRVYKTYNGTKYYGEWSDEKTVKIK